MLFYKHEDDKISKLETRLLVSCPREGPGQAGFYLVDVGENSCRQLTDCDGRGLARCQGGYFAASRNDGVFQFDQNLNVVAHHFLPYLDLHGLRIGPNGLLYAVETIHNRIGIYRPETFERLDEFIISSPVNDHNHVNDFHITDGRLFVSMFSYHGSWRSNWETGIFDGAVVEFDVEKRTVRRLVAGNLRMPHTVIRFGDDLCFCESFNMNVIRNGEVLAQFAGYTRGLDFDGCYYFVGQSRMRHWGRHREPNLSVDAGIHVVDSQSRVSRFIQMPVKQIYDILILD